MACVRYRRGRWVIDFYHQEGKRRRETLPKGIDRKGANEKLGEMERKVRRPMFPPRVFPPSPTWRLTGSAPSSPT